MGKNTELKITFLGATETVTGSKTMLTYKGKSYLVDCGLYQGPRVMREKNWEKFEHNIEAVILTHAHIDHSGFLPKLVHEGFKGPIYCSEATKDLCDIMLLDSAHLQNEDARFYNKRRISRHIPALPLYSEADVDQTMKLFNPIELDQWIELDKGFSIRLLRSGHILGSTYVQVSFESGNGVELLTFSGDLGNGRQNVIKGPAKVGQSDYLVLEGTYGDRLQPRGDVLPKLAEVINRTYKRKGVLIIPSFAVGRTQEVLYLLRVLEEDGSIPEIPVYLDSPMANRSTQVYLDHHKDLKLRLKDGEFEIPLCTKCFTTVKSADDSMLLCMRDGPMIVISAAGMLTGGRVLHHLKHRLPHPENTVLFIGYQGVETKGRLLQNGLMTIRIHKQLVDVEAEIATISELSAHADSQDLLEWVKDISPKPKKIFLNHGEGASLRALKYRLETELDQEVVIPVEGQEFVL